MNNPKLEKLLQKANEIILGKPEVIKLAMTCVLSGGHLLIEDLPGMGKTTLAHTLATLLGMDYQRIQFTSDLLPADVIGVSIYDRSSEQFHFHAGPIFAQLVLADEINRATPKTQSALLEAMEEQQITVEGKTRPLPKPFFVIATQNPANQVGTFQLPESQLDRFLMRISLGYPSKNLERMLLQGQGGRANIHHLKPLIEPQTLLNWQQQISAVHMADPLLDYIQDLIHESRNNPALIQGLSPRAGLALVQATKAWAWIEGRAQTLPEDVQAVWNAVAGHRLAANDNVHNAQDLSQQILRAVAIP